jgi:mannose-6-phosphate isomerase-like protein (cupin superfamily)
MGDAGSAEPRILIEPHEGRTVWLGGQGVTFRLFGEDTGGAFSIVEHPMEPGTLVPPHMHTHEDEFSFVLEGAFGVRIGDRIAHATPGSYVFKPRGIPHTFWNPGPDPARLIEIISPPGFERFFEEVAGAIEVRERLDPNEIAAIARRYGSIAEWWDWVPELEASYGVKLYNRDF